MRPEQHRYGPHEHHTLGDDDQDRCPDPARRERGDDADFRQGHVAAPGRHHHDQLTSRSTKMSTVEQANSRTADICTLAEVGPDALALMSPEQKPPDYVAVLVDKN